MDDVAAPCPRAAKWPNFFGARQACRAVPARRAVPCPDMNVDDLAVSCPRAVLRPGGGGGGGGGGGDDEEEEAEEEASVPCRARGARAVPCPGCLRHLAARAELSPSSRASAHRACSRVALPCGVSLLVFLRTAATFLRSTSHRTVRTTPCYVPTAYNDTFDCKYIVF
ncbi:unnamed protein product [Prorocentrum cordatum]|uniref:Uncharacterized protein n=1 Tax=Prorocentrum cordatum TaxID=2364126 RepID=A0ABN9W554_9DINO|nr:unnamed protein product [Polarella glacialis]